MPTASSLIVLAGALTALGTLGAGPAHAQGGMTARIEESDVTTHRSQGEVKKVEGGKGTLLRTPEGIFANLETQGLTPGQAYTLVMVTINNPSACESSPCPPADVLKRTAETKSDARHADGTIVGEDGTARFAVFQPAGELPDAWFGNGLQDPMAAEVHLVVNDHGPLIPELAANMVTTYRGGCGEGIPEAFPDTAKADGTPGPNTCRLVQVAVFVPTEAQVGRKPD